METFFQQFFNLLVTPPGNLIYHLVVAFSITAALQMVILRRSSTQVTVLTRIITGLGLLLLAQIILFLSSGLTWQGVLDPQKFLPVLDRSIGTFSLLCILWMWVFSSPLRLADALFGIAGFVWTILLIFSFIGWNSQDTLIAFNASWLDWIWAGVTIIALLAGILLLFIKRPPAWEVGIAAFALNLAGYAGHLALTTANGDFSTAIRFVHICTFPLLPMLTQQLQREEVREDIHAVIEVTTKAPKDFLHLKDALLLAAQNEPEEICQSLTQVICQSTRADICLMAYLDDSQKEFIIQCGYDRTENRPLGEIKLTQMGIPALVNAVQLNRLQEINLDTITAPDLDTIGEVLGLQQPCPLLLLPLPLEKRPLALLLLSPHTGQTLSPEEQSQLFGLTSTMVQILHQSLLDNTPDVAEQETAAFAEKELENARSNLEQLEREIMIIEADNLQLQQANTELTTKFTQLQEDVLLLGSQVDLSSHNLAEHPPETMPENPDSQEVSPLELESILSAIEADKKKLEDAGEEFTRDLLVTEDEFNDLEFNAEDALGIEVSGSPTDPLSAAVSTEEDAQKIIADLLSENEQLRLTMKDVPQDQTMHQETEQMRAELNSTLDEVSFLENSLADARKELTELSGPSRQSINGQDTITWLMQEIQPPVAAINGYVDLLLSETVGGLGSVQRRFLERIKNSTLRMNELIADLEDLTDEIELDKLELETLIQAAFQEAVGSHPQQVLELTMDTLQDLPPIKMTAEMLRKQIIQVILSAQSTPIVPGTTKMQIKINESDPYQAYLELRTTSSSQTAVEPAKIPLKSANSTLETHHEAND